MEDFDGVSKPPAVDPRPLIENQVSKRCTAHRSVGVMANCIPSCFRWAVLYRAMIASVIRVKLGSRTVALRCSVEVGAGFVVGAELNLVLKLERCRS